MNTGSNRKLWVVVAVMAAAVLALTAGVSAAGLARDARTPAEVPNIETSLPLASQIDSSPVTTESATPLSAIPTPRSDAEEPDAGGAVDSDKYYPTDDTAQQPQPVQPPVTQPSVEGDDEGDEEDREVIRPDVRDDEDEESDD